jgi:hypothetical protein
VIRDQSEAREGINVCNYDRLDKIDPEAFGAAALDESSILKSFAGKTSRGLIQAFAGHRFRLSATATPAPNDHMELGQHADFCGVMASNEMLSRFFINDTSTASQEWRLKRHGVNAFWDWMSSWCRMAQHTMANFVADMGQRPSPAIASTGSTTTARTPRITADGLRALSKATINARAGVARRIAAR